MKFVTLFLFVFVVLFMGYHIISFFSRPLRTVTCVLLQTEESVTVRGFFVRDESLLPLPQGTLQTRADDGERVSPGQVVAVGYEVAADVQSGQELRLLKSHLEQLLYIQGHTFDVSDAQALRENLRNELTAFKDTWDTGRFQALKDSSLTLRAALFREEYTLNRRESIEEMIQRTQTRIAVLESEIENVTTAVRAPESGLFCSSSDGLETLLTPGALENLTAADFDRLYAIKPEPVSGMAKMILDDLYYYVCELPESSARLLRSPAAVRFTDELSAFTLSMDVVSISEAENGRCAVVLSSRRYLPRFLRHRKLEADIVFSEHRGLRVPRDAVRVDEDGTPYVFCNVVGLVTRKNLDIILDVSRENYYLCEYAPGSLKNLLPGDEIITEGKELYDGKVILK